MSDYRTKPILCVLGLHKWRTVERKPLPALPPKFKAPEFYRVLCLRCCKSDWSFKP